MDVLRAMIADTPKRKSVRGSECFVLRIEGELVKTAIPVNLEKDTIAQGGIELRKAIVSALTASETQQPKIEMLRPGDRTGGETQMEVSRSDLNTEPRKAQTEQVEGTEGPRPDTGRRNRSVGRRAQEQRQGRSTRHRPKEDRASRQSGGLSWEEHVREGREQQCRT